MVHPQPSYQEKCLVDRCLGWYNRSCLFQLGWVLATRKLGLFILSLVCHGGVLSYPLLSIPPWNIFKMFRYKTFVLEKYSDTLPTYGIIFRHFASKNILATCERYAGKYSWYMLRVSKLNIAEHDGVWHHSFCTCSYRAGTNASFFPQGMKLQRRHPTLHPTLHIPKLH
jgi:hypothetical protein